MAIIEGIRIKNYRALHDITMGRLWNRQDEKPLKALTVIIGKNGVGKSTLFDAFGFLADCMKLGVEDACLARGRGGYDKIYSQGAKGPIEFEVYYKESVTSRPITYEIAIDLDKRGIPIILRERLRQRRKGQKRGRPFSFLILDKGKGMVWKGEYEGHQFDENGLFDAKAYTQTHKEESNQTECVELNDINQPGITTLGSLKQHPRILAFRNFIENWYLCYFTPDAARSLPLAGPQKHLNLHGDNLGNVVQFMERAQGKRFQRILESISKKIPGLQKIDTEKTSDGRLLLRFFNQGFERPFYAQQISDGTLKVFAYMLMLEDPSPASLLCIEEPENGIYHKLLYTLVEEFRSFVSNAKNQSQVIVTTHQPYFLDALEPDEVWVLEKQPDGYSTITRADSVEFVQNMFDEGQPLGSLWYSDYLDK